MWADEGDAVAKQATVMMEANGIPLLSEAIEVWAKWKHEELNPKNLKQMRMSVNHLIAAVGDKPITKFTRQDAQDFIAYLLDDRGNKVSSIDRNISNIRTLLNRSINKFALDIPNPFNNLDLPRQAEGEGRGEFEEAELLAIKEIAEGRQFNFAANL